MKRIAICIIISAAGVLLAPQVASADPPHDGCPHGALFEHPYEVDGCLKVGETGTTAKRIPGEQVPSPFAGIDVTVHNVWMQPAQPAVSIGPIQLGQQPPYLMVDATVHNAAYMDTVPKQANGAATPCPWAPDEYCAPADITVGQWVLVTYDKNWHGANAATGQPIGYSFSPTQDGLSAKCADITKCNPYEDLVSHFCIDPGDALDLGDVVKKDEEKQWIAGLEAIATRNPALAAMKDVPLGELGNPTCTDAITVHPGDSQSGQLGFAAQTTCDTGGAPGCPYRGATVPDVKVGQNVAIVWSYGGAGFAWLCKVGVGTCKPVQPSPTIPKTPTTSTTPPAAACSAGSLTAAVQSDPNFNADPREGPDEVVTVDSTDPSWVLFQSVPAPENAAAFPSERGVAQCVNGSWQISNDPAAPGLGCTAVPSDVAVQLGVNTDSQCTPR
jgi:hypothetical protein